MAHIFAFPMIPHIHSKHPLPVLRDISLSQPQQPPLAGPALHQVRYIHAEVCQIPGHNTLRGFAVCQIGSIGVQDCEIHFSWNKTGEV